MATDLSRRQFLKAAGAAALGLSLDLRFLFQALSLIHI